MPISIRIVHLDHYLAKPGPLDRAFSPFSDRELSKVPVLRIFGSTKAGQKVCLHIHQVFPYFFVHYSIPAEYTTEKEIQKDIFQFGTSLNEAMNLARPNNEKDQHIAAIVLTKGIPFYGYHIGYQTYLKIYITNPYEKQQMLDILQSSAIGNTFFQPYEAHLNFELQFLMDHNLYGMDWAHIDENHGLDTTSASFGIRFRLPLLDEPKATYVISQSSSTISSNVASEDDSLPVYTSKTVPLQLQSDTIPRQSYCELEMDITGMSILNRHDLKEQSIHTSLKKEKEIQAVFLANGQEQDKLVKSLDSIWKDEVSRRRSRGIKEPIPPVEQIDAREPRVPWSAEPSLRRLMEKMMTRKPFDEISETQDPSVLIPGVMTVFQAVEALYPEDYFIYAQQGKQSLQSQPSQERSKVELLSSPTEPFSPILPSSSTHATPGRLATSPPSITPVSNQFNVSATPSRYRVWNLPSQLDKSVMHTVMKEASFHQEAEEGCPDDKVIGDEENEQEGRINNDGDDDEEAFSIENSIRNSDLVQWLEKLEAEAEDQRRAVQTIEYEPPEPIYQPRKLDFIAESKKMDAILKAEPKNPNKNILDFSEDAEEVNVPFNISDIPPESMPHMLRSLQRIKRVDQLDGASDRPEIRRDKRQKSAQERWEQEKKTLKRMRKKKSIAKQLQRDQRASSAPPETHVEPIDMRRIMHPEGMEGIQKVTAKIPRHVPMKQRSTPKREEMSSSTEAFNRSHIVNEANFGATSHYNEGQERDQTFSSQIESFNTDSKSQVSVLQGDSQSSIHKPEECASVESWLYDPAVFEDTQSPNIDPTDWTPVAKEFVYSHAPPVISELDVPKQGVMYQEPFYSNPSDLPRYPTVFSGKEFRLPTSGLESLKRFKSSFDTQTHSDQVKNKTRIKVWTPSQEPPSLQDVKEWLHNEGTKNKSIRPKDMRSQLSKPTALNPFNFKSSASKPQAKVKRVRDFIHYFSLEVHVNTRDQLLPDPQHDAVQLVFWCLQTEDDCIPSNGYQEGYHVGVIAMNDFDVSKIGFSKTRLDIDYAQSEEQLFSILIEKIRYYDPDMLVGYEIQSASWGYLVDRGVQLGYHMLDELSRVIVTSETIKRDQWGYQKASVYRVFGRHMMNVWRLMKGDLTLTSYTFENVAYHLLHDRIPRYSYATLTNWYKKGPAVLKYRLFKYYMKRVQLNLDMLDASQVVSRTCESARVYGIDFYAVITRGSQYKVESIMFRIAKPENYVLLTPNRQQVASQRSLEELPLIMEPISQFYSSPMVVLDFQSLYPSIMIAYNYCYSTCLGRVCNPGESSRLGVLNSFELDDGLLDTLKDYINVSPNGIMFVKPEIRKSLLAKMLSELLDTRVMIKRAMKGYTGDSGLLRTLDAKQLTLKLLANVTYGYTSASFSGRMPSVEIADSIVSTGRETLERAIRLINETEKWGARVVYGDTDSVFVYFPGKTRQEAFTLGNEIAETVTKMNPNPVKLKFEKVYHPAVLLAKKRYVGFKYEHPSDTEPVFEAKGIETVRRDGTAATQKILESSLKILFRRQDMSELKAFLYRQWTRILSNRVLLQDFIIAKEVRMGTYSSRGGPNGAQIAQAQMNMDARAEPQYGERVPYVVVYRGPNARLKDKVIPPEILLQDSSLRLDAEYYIRKQIIPPLSRIFNLVGVDILTWYDSMPRSQKIAAMNLAQNTEHQPKNLTRIDQYYASSHCIICRKLTDQFLCEQCRQNPSQTIFNLTSRQQLTQQKFRKILQVCQDCSTLSPLDAMMTANLNTEPMADIPCISLDCPIFYERLKAKQDVHVTLSYNSLIDGFSKSLL